MITAVQPAARAAPSFRVIIADGKFQGVRIDLSRKVSNSAGAVQAEGTHTTPEGNNVSERSKEVGAH